MCRFTLYLYLSDALGGERLSATPLHRLRIMEGPREPEPCRRCHVGSASPALSTPRRRQNRWKRRADGSRTAESSSAQSPNVTSASRTGESGSKPCPITTSAAGQPTLDAPIAAPTSRRALERAASDYGFCSATSSCLPPRIAGRLAYDRGCRRAARLPQEMRKGSHHAVPAYSCSL